MLKTLTAIGIGAAIAFAPLAALAQNDTTTAPAAAAPAASDATTPPAKAMKAKHKKHMAKKHTAKKAAKPAEESAPAAPADDQKN